MNVRYLPIWITTCLWTVFAQGPSTALPVQPLGPDDLVSVSVYGAPDLTRNFRVDQDGVLRLPMLKPILANGKLPTDLETAIAAALKAERIMVDPAVSVAVVEYASRPITVMGAVKHPVTFQATGRVTLLDALARAEGLNPEAGNEIVVTRREPVKGEEVMTISVQKLINRADDASNLRLFGGEQIRVPDARRVYILGNVRRPCSMPVKDPAESTLLRLLTQAEGLAPFASQRAYIYRRGNGDAPRAEMAIELKKIMNGQSPDVRLEPLDIVYIPDAKGRRITSHVLDQITGFGMSTFSGFLVFR